MFVSDEEAKERGLNIKAWLSELQIAAKEPNAPTFKLKGACKLSVRRRSNKNGVTSSSVMHTFMGQEEFRVSSFFPERMKVEQGTRISVTFVPAAAGLAVQVSSLTLSLVEAIELLEGSFETWVTDANNRAALKKTQRQSVIERVTANVPQKAEDNPLYGSW